ncbi:MAG: hypothetical protein JWQ78_1986 [Sediminibacterium sp.]|nr:hypothetical protein [Sediminibacterium sp.]
MEKKPIRCYKEFAHVYPGIYNYEVYCMIYEGWSNFSLVTCMNCGELFVIDWENPLTEKRSIESLAENKLCPSCNIPLKESIKEYPQNIRLKDGKVGSFAVSNRIPEDDESLVMNFYTLM